MDKRAEAVKRMNMLKMRPEAIRQFEQDGLVNISEPPVGALFWLDDEDKKRVAEFEKEHNALVYTIIRSYTSLGKLDSFLYVSDYEEEWEEDIEYLKQGQVFAYVYNHDMPDCSEFGTIGIELAIGAGLKRVW